MWKYCFCFLAYAGGRGSGGSGGSSSGGGAGGDNIAMLEKAVPGVPGQDYPIYAEVPETSFSCTGQVDGGYYADPDAQCQVGQWLKSANESNQSFRVPELDAINMHLQSIYMTPVLHNRL